jgi:hypothetical protein
MRIFSRVFFTLALLGGLAYGSYAFGAYVLSSRLFGNKGSKLNQNFGESPLPRAGSGKVASGASASVEILPENGQPGVSRPATSRVSASDTLTDRSNQSGDDGSLRGASDSLETPSYRSDADSSRTRRTRSSASSDTSTERPRRKRKRRPRPTPAPQISTPREEPVRRDEAPEAEERIDADVVIRGDGDSNFSPREDPAPSAERIEPRRETVRDNSSAEERPRRRRRVRERAEEPAPRIRERVRTRERIEPRRETPSRREESPVPVPESGGSESPVPIPE